MKTHTSVCLIVAALVLTSCSDETVLIVNTGHTGDHDKPVSCVDSCQAGSTECTDNGLLRVCDDTDGDGCLEYKEQKCGAGKVCKNGSCAIDTEKPEDPQDPDKPHDPPTETCQDECLAGSKSCSGDGKSIVCMDADDDGCLENRVAECSQNTHCDNGVCVDDVEEPDPCSDMCSKSGVTECVGTGAVRTCGNFDDDKCLEWSDETACPSNTSCKDGKCQCANKCGKNGDVKCDGNGYRTCTDTNGDGCLEWSSVTSCNGMACKDGSCTCNNACNNNAKECSGTGFRTCTKDGNGCNVWSSVTPCENGCENGSCKAADVQAPTHYPGNQILSPITSYSVAQMKAIAAKKSRKDIHFAKIGDSHFAPGSAFMYCFSKDKTQNLAGADFLKNVIQAFQSDGTNSFSRDSVSAVVGWRVNNAVGGKLTEELNAMNPRFAFIDYGSNDMGWFGYTRPEGKSNTGYFYTLEGYYRTYRQALDQMIPVGVIPIIIGTGIQIVNTYQGQSLGYLNPRYFVAVFDAVNRGLAEQYQIPYVNLALLQSQEPLRSNNFGLRTSDNLHATSYGNGCDFSSTGMKYGHNARNRYSIEQLDRAWKTVVNGEKAPDKAIPFEGKGTMSAPYIISEIPWTHAGNTTKGTNHFSSYSCGTASEIGPEIVYKYTTKTSKKIRAFAVSANGVDADIHLKNSLDDNKCMARGDKWVEANLSAGTYYFVIDTCDSANKAGEYMFGIVECESGDTLCGSKTTGG